MPLPLPNPPDSLKPQARQFYDELRAMLEVVRPQELDPIRTSVEFPAGGIEVCLGHRSQAEWTIRAAVMADNAIVEVGPMHEHFDADEAGRPWPLVAVDFIAEILRGEIESEITYRAEVPVRVSHHLTDPDGDRQLLETTTTLRPAALMLWKPTRTETLRITFRAQG